MMKQFKDSVMRFWKDEEGLGTLEIILIIAVLLILAIAFRKWIIQWFQNLLDNSNETIREIEEDEINVPTID